MTRTSVRAKQMRMYSWKVQFTRWLICWPPYLQSKTKIWYTLSKKKGIIATGCSVHPCGINQGSQAGQGHSERPEEGPPDPLVDVNASHAEHRQEGRSVGDAHGEYEAVDEYWEHLRDVGHLCRDGWVRQPRPVVHVHYQPSFHGRLGQDVGCGDDSPELGQVPGEAVDDDRAEEAVQDVQHQHAIWSPTRRRRRKTKN